VALSDNSIGYTVAELAKKISFLAKIPRCLKPLTEADLVIKTDGVYMTRCFEKPEHMKYLPRIYHIVYIPYGI